MAQFPLNIGKDRKVGNVLSTTVNAQGKLLLGLEIGSVGCDQAIGAIQYDAVVQKEGQRVYSNAMDLVERVGDKSLSFGK